MRTIKFRGKVKRTNEWKYGSLLTYADGECNIITETGHRIDTWNVDPSSVGQFIGVLDSKGKEIYENDIVHFINPGLRYDIVAPVVYEHGDFCLQKNPQYLIPMGNFEDYCFEVIGNIHDNPELNPENNESTM